MQIKTLGTSSLRVSAVGLGTMAFGRWIDEATSFELLDYAVAHGITLIDTADYCGPGQDAPVAFGDGTSETIIGHWLQHHPEKRDAIVLASKVGQNTDPQQSHPTLSRAHILEQIDGSLKRLHTNHLDLYQAHRFDTATPLEETLTTLSGLVDAGKIRYYGVSNYSPEQLQAAENIVTARNLHPFVSVQNRCNLLTAKDSAPALTYAQDHRLGYLAYSPLARGVLTGKYLNGNVPAGSRLSQGERMLQEYMDPADEQKVARFAQLAQDAGVSMTQLAFGWLLAHPSVTTTLFGASKLRYFAPVLAAADHPLPADLVAELNQL